VTTSYLWCGSDICQARNAGNASIRSYYDEGELVPGTPAQTLYYGIDQIGSVRRVFASTSSAPAYGYDPYGVPLQATAPLTDFVYGGMFYNADSGLYLTRYRAYASVAGRWLSRDPFGEPSDPTANLYAYVGGNPLSFIDPEGLLEIFFSEGISVRAFPGPAVGGIEHGPPHVHLRQGSDEVQIRTDNWEPMREKDKETLDKNKKLRDFCKSLTPPEKSAIRGAQSDIFSTGKILPNTAMRLGGLKGPGGRGFRGRGGPD